jgi:hypothetical protein
LLARSLFGGLVLSTTLLVTAACGDSTGPGGSGGRPPQGGEGNGPSTGGSGGGTGGTAPIGGEGAGPVGGSGGSSGEGGSGGEPPNPAPGAPGQSFVSSGNQASSPNYKLIHTTGQPTINQTNMSSPSFTLQGGLIGATGSQP